VGVRIPRSPHLDFFSNRLLFFTKFNEFMKIDHILLFIIFLFFVHLSHAQQKDIKFDMKYQIISNDYLLINDTLNHKIGKAAGVGSAVTKDGASADVKVYFIYDYKNGNGDFTEYYCLTFRDSSTLTLQAKGRSIGSTDESQPLFTAVVTITGGTGVYTGVQGSGSLTGNRKSIIEPGAIVKLSFSISTK
jgi:hypothetical protein